MAGAAKKISSWVRPGVCEVRASALRPVSALIRLDLPTLERPAKAISSPRIGGSTSNVSGGVEELPVAREQLAAGFDLVGGEVGHSNRHMRRASREGARMSLPRLYTDLASWWPLLSPPEHYEEEAEVIIAFLREALGKVPATILELGSGGGNSASYLKRHATMTLVDLSPDMLAVSRKLNPGVEHVGATCAACASGGPSTRSSSTTRSCT